MSTTEDAETGGTRGGGSAEPPPRHLGALPTPVWNAEMVVKTPFRDAITPISAYETLNQRPRTIAITAVAAANVSTAGRNQARSIQ
jgi:hypothetical protein